MPAYGFLKSRITKGKLYATYYFTRNTAAWEVWNAPVIELLKVKDDSSDEAPSKEAED